VGSSANKRVHRREFLFGSVYKLSIVKKLLIFFGAHEALFSDFSLNFAEKTSSAISFWSLKNV
jgi:hypothetical protein